ncbi:MAG: EscU/YscU/HrcU family type III secretion system export apparatus switch protein [bacterium]
MGDEDKQFEASGQKLSRARKEGQVVKSKDLSMALSMLLMFAIIKALAPFIWDQMAGMFTLLYEQIPNRSFEDIGPGYLLFMTAKPLVLIIGPIMALAVFVAVMVDMIQVGPLIATAVLSPKLDKLNPTKYFKNLMSIKTFFDLFKNIVKVAVLGAVGFLVYKDHLAAILGLVAIDNNFAVMMEFGKLIGDFIIKAGIIFLIIAGADYAVTKWKFMKDQKMSFKEVKDEYKNSEGDPHVKAALRQRRFQMLQQGSADMVMEADFVVTNPSHVAVAVKYDEATMEAPKVLAKGEDMSAEKIKNIAKENNIPIIENPPVARALFKFVNANQDVPAELYQAVAEILLFVYDLRKQ